MKKKVSTALKKQIARWAIGQLKKHKVPSFLLNKAGKYANSKIKNKYVRGAANYGIKSAASEVRKRGFGIGLSGGSYYRGISGSGLKLAGQGCCKMKRRIYRRR